MPIYEPLNLTPRQTLLYCKEMWEWLAANPSKKKSQWHSTDGTVSGLSAANCCWCCQYSFEEQQKRTPGTFSVECSKRETDYTPRFEELIPLCLLKQHWPNGCEADDSSYTAWKYAKTDQDRTKAALKIAAACDEALKQYPE